MPFERDFLAALGGGIDAAQLRALAPERLWRERPQWAAMSALARSRLFDAADYLRRYPDVAAAGVDPILHFATCGYAENRHFNIRGAATAPKRQRFRPDEPDAISVIIPAYNAEKPLERAVASILAQTHENLEIFIYDDASTDGTMAVMARLAAQNPCVRLLGTSVNAGQGRARNECLKIAKGAWAAFVDADDYYADADFLQKLLAQTHAAGADAAVTPYLRRKNGKISQDECATGLMSGAAATQKFLDRAFGTHAPGAKLFRMDIARACRFSEHGFSQDVQFCAQALRRAGRVLAAPVPGYVYDNDNVSSWRPSQLTPLHFYSSLRALLEITVFGWENNCGLTQYARLWRKDHGKRLREFVAEPQNIGSVREILGYFKFFAPFLEAHLPWLRHYHAQAGETVAPCAALPAARREYVEEQEQRLAARLACAGPARPLIAIWSEHLGGGGLERVAALLGKALLPKYDIVYVLDDPTKVDYDIDGTILRAEIFDPAVQKALRQASYIFDFHWKNPRDHFPLCLHMLAQYAHKYVPTIHNTKTCGRYFDVIAAYLRRLGVAPARLPAIVCVSGAVRQAFLREYGAIGNVQVVHNPIDLAAIAAAPVPPPGEPYILFCGRLDQTEHKGIDLLLRAYAASTAKARAKLLLTGANELEPAMREYIATHGLGERVEIVGFTDQIFSLMKGALFLAAPSRWEGFGMQIVESLAAGTPVASARVGIAPEVIVAGENGLIVENENMAELTKALDYMAVNAQGMRANCLASVAWLDAGGYYGRLKAALDL